MFGTMVVGSAAFFLVATAALEMVDTVVDHRRLNSVKPRSSLAEATVVRSPHVGVYQAPVQEEALQKAA